MSPKSKHSRGRRHRKKSKFRQVQPVAGLPQETSANIARADAPVTAPLVAKAHVPKKASTSAALPLHYEFIAGDLKRIGILTGIVVVLLIAAYYIFT